MQAMLKTLCSHRNFNNFVINSRNTQEITGDIRNKYDKSINFSCRTGKISYATSAKAWHVIKRMKDRNRNRKVYRCSECDRWHIGTWQKKPAGLSLSKPAGLSLSKSDARRTVADRDCWEAQG